MKEPVQALEGVLSEADVLIRQRLKERGIEFPHLVVAVTHQGQVVLRTNVSTEGLRSFGEDLISAADGFEAPPEAGQHEALINRDRD